MKKENIDAINHLRRLKLLNKILLLTLIWFQFLNADSGYYVCSNDQVYKDYKNGLVSNLDGATKFSTELLCSYDCNQYEVCKPEKVYNTDLSPMFNCIDATKAREIQNYFATKKFQTINFKSMGIPSWSVDFNEAKDGSSFVFPYAFDLSNNMSAWDHNGTSVKIAKDASNYVEIIMTIEGTAEHNVSGKIYKGDKVYTIKGVIGGEVNTVKCGLFNNTGEMVNYENQFELVTNANTYYCPLRKSENIGGDYNSGSNFQTQSKCNAACTVKNECIQVADTPCKPININYSQYVTDYTGKSVATKRSISYECNSTVTKTVGCANWKIITNQGSVDVNMSKVGTSFKERTNSATNASVLSNMLEGQFHLFTGWKGQCDHGKMFNNPFSDPFKLLSYAMMVYSASAKVDTGTTDANGAPVYNYPMGQTMSNLHDSFDNATTSFQNGWKDITSKLLSSQTNPTDAQYSDYVSRYTSAADAASSGILSSVDEMTQTIKDYVTSPINTIDVGYGTVKVYLVDYIQLGMSMVPTKEELKTSSDFNKAWLGDENADNQSVAYATCMASIGLSFPNLISYVASDINATSKELSYPYDNPLRLSYTQIQYLAGATSQKFVENMYAYVANNPSAKYVTVIAKNGQAYYQAGQVICGGKIAVASNANSVAITSNSNNSSSGSNMGEAVAMMAVKKLLAALPPPYNIMATVLLDLVMAFDSVNACSNLEDATKLGVLQMKTNRFINYNQCYATESTCQKKFLGKCILKRNYHCCYDQITTRIFAEGVKEQLGLDRNVCNNITLEHLKLISFRKCASGENPKADNCFPSAKWDEYQAAITAQGVTGFDASALVQTGINSLGVTNTLQCK